MVEEEPRVGQLHEPKSNKTIHFYYPKKYYPTRSGRDEYSYKIVLSKKTDLSDFFWRHVEKTMEYARHWNEIFDYSCVIPNSDGSYSPTLMALQEKIRIRYKIEPLNILRKKAGSMKQTDISDADERKENARIGAEICEDERINGSSVLLVDDVKTSGSSILAYASRLYAKGAQNVAAIVLGENEGF